ncbi:MAG: leucyl/phenylalanyl-tRNA--protein transferase [Fimbriimonadales bacterium]
MLELAYSHGVFPMGMPDGEIGWFRPDPRAIIPLDGFRVARSLRKSDRRFEVRFDSEYERVMRACADREETWITEEFVCAYTEMFRMGQGHCSEAWIDVRLVGGVYGFALGRAFFAESMFHLVTDAGKVALWRLVEFLKERNFGLLDVQYLTPHLESLGAIEISSAEYMDRLGRCL